MTAVVLVALLVPLWLLLGTAAARDADARGRQGRWIGVAWVVCFPVGVVMWADSRRYERLADRRRALHPSGVEPGDGLEDDLR